MYGYPNFSPFTVGQTPAADFRKQQEKYVIALSQRKVSENQAAELLKQLQRPWPEAGSVRFDRWADRKNHGFMGDKPNHTKKFGQGVVSNSEPFGGAQRMEITGATKVYGWSEKDFKGDLAIYPPGNHSKTPKSITVVPAVDFERLINDTSEAISKFAQFSHGCLLNKDNYETHPLVVDYAKFLDRIKELFKGTPLEAKYEEKKQKVLLSLSEDILRDAECALLNKAPEAPCPEGFTRINSPDEAIAYQYAGWVEEPAGSGCYGKKIQCTPGSFKAQTQAAAEVLAKLGYTENPPGSRCYLKPGTKPQSPQGDDCITFLHQFPNKEYVCIPPKIANCLKEGGWFESKINANGKVRKDTIACVYDNVRRVTGQPGSPARSLWYEDIKSKICYPKS